MICRTSSKLIQSMSVWIFEWYAPCSLPFLGIRKTALLTAPLPGWCMEIMPNSQKEFHIAISDLSSCVCVRLTIPIEVANCPVYAIGPCSKSQNLNAGPEFCVFFCRSRKKDRTLAAVEKHTIYSQSGCLLSVLCYSPASNYIFLSIIQ